MRPVTHPEENVVYKGPTPDIGDLSCYRPKPGLILSEWDLTIAERLALMRGARVELGISTEPIPPVSLAIVNRPGPDGEPFDYVEPHGPYRAVDPGDLTESQVRAAAECLGLTLLDHDSERPLFYVLSDAQTELHLSRAWRWTKRLMPERWFRHTKLALANAILATALTRTQPGWTPVKNAPANSHSQGGC